MDPIVKEIKQLAEDVIADDHGYVNSIGRERAAEADLIALILHYVRDALPAICSAVVEHEKPSSKSDYFDWRGALLSGGPTQRADGVVEGSALYVTEGGSFRVVSFSGMWTKKRVLGRGFDEQDGHRREQEWVAQASDELTPREIVQARYGVAEVAVGLVSLLRKQSDGSKAQVAERADERAAKLEAIAVLMGGGS